MKNLCWITADYFLQVDLPVLLHLTKQYRITWYYLENSNSTKFESASSYAQLHSIPIKYIKIQSHRYSPLTFFDYSALFKEIAKQNYDFIYLNAVCFPYMIFAVKRYLISSPLIIAMHHGEIHNGMQLRF